jgi:hypothetical protein
MAAEEITIGPQTNGNGHVSFSEVVRVHYRWAQQFHHGREAAKTSKQELEDALRQFEADQGKIVDAYWCMSQASAAALTEKDLPAPPRWHHIRLPWRKKPEPELRLHRVTDWVTNDHQQIAELLHHCDALAIRVEAVLTGVPRHVAMRWLMSVEENLLGFVERAKRAAPRTAGNGTPATPIERRQRQSQLDKFVARQRTELIQLEDYYDRAGQKHARQIYVTGMGIGALCLIPLAVGAAGLLAVFGVLDLHAPGVRRFFACFAAGALGAIVSVLSRMSGRGGGFIVDHEIGDSGIHRLGGYRPLIGGVFGVALYFLARTSLLHLERGLRTFPFFVIVAFLAGFSERWAQIVLGGAEKTVSASLGAKPGGE